MRTSAPWRAGTPSPRRTAPGSGARSRSRSSPRRARPAPSRRAARATAAPARRRCRPRCRRSARPSSGQSGTSPSTIACSGSMWAPNAPARRMSATSGMPACSTSRSMPARSAALASWIARTSFCVIATRSLARRRRSTYENVRPSSTMRGVRSASAPWTTPSWSMMPARYISATTSMMPEPQMPVMPVRRDRARRSPGRRDHTSTPITLRRGSSVSRVDAHALDRTGRGALAAADLRALERRAGGAATRRTGGSRRRARSRRWCRRRRAAACVSRAVRALGEDRRRRCRRRRGRRCTGRRTRARWAARRSSVGGAR